MIRVVIDTNVLVSSLLSPQGYPARILELVAEGAVRLCLSPSIMAEYQNVLVRKKFGFAHSTVKSVLSGIKRLSLEIIPSEFFQVCNDPADNKFVDSAVAAGADYIITGNQKHFPKSFRSIHIVSPSEFVRVIAGNT